MLQKSRFASTASFGSFARSDPSSSPRRYPLMSYLYLSCVLTRHHWLVAQSGSRESTVRTLAAA